MTDAVVPGASTRLYSETPHDDRGNFSYQGDLQQPRETTADLARRIADHLAASFPACRFAIRHETFAGGRKIIAELLDAPDDLSGREAQHAFITRVQDQMHRFRFTRSNLLQDFHSTSFFADVILGRAYWSALAARRGRRNPVDARLSLAAFKKLVEVGDQLKLVDAPSGHRALGTVRTIIAVRSKDLILEGKSYLTLPRAGAFACDGRLMRIAIGNDHDPDAHLLYEWLQRAA